MLLKYYTSDAVKKTTVATLYLSQDRNWIEHTTNLDNDAILVNLGYPLHYLKGYVWSWEIVRNVGNVANVIVTDIDFNIYEVINFCF